MGEYKKLSENYGIAEHEQAQILENALDAVVATDEQNRVIFWNKNAEKTFGWSNAEMIGQDLTERIVPERLREAHRAGVRRFLDTGIPKIQNRRIEISALRRSGEEFPIELTLSSVQSGSSFRFYSFMRDLTVEKRLIADGVATNNELIFQKQKLDALVSESLSAVGLMRGPDLIFELVNQKWVELVSHRKYIDRKYADVYPELLGSLAHRSMIEVFETGQPFEATEMKVAVQTKGGIIEDQYFNFKNVLIRDVQGRPYGVYCNALNVTEQVAARTRVQETEANLRAAINSSEGGFYGVDQGGITTVCNPAFLTMLGFDREEDAVGRKLHDVIHHSHPDGRHYSKIDCPIYQAASSGKPAHVVDELFFRLDGSSFPVEYWTAPILREGHVLGAVTTFIDISERKLAEAALRTAKENAELLRAEAERANLLKSAFLANMSHEIRTPLGAMLGFADLLKDRGLSAGEQANYINIMIRNGEQLALIINDILDLSKVEAGHLTLEFTDTYHQLIGSDVVSLLHVKAREKDLALEYNFDESTPEVITADPTRVRQILLNLVGNAIKFTQFGSVKIKTCGCQVGERPALCFEITDTGIGISKDQQARLFQPFSQADETTTRRFGGTGLGLALSRRLARELGGDISIVRSEVGIGTTFLVKIADQPEKRSAPEDTFKSELRVEPEIKENELAGMRILVVDDAPDNQQLIWRYLTKQGASVQSAENGLIGYRTALAGDFDLVLMDIQMPVMDGYTATQKLRDAGYQKPVVALTAHAMNDIRKKALNVGYTDHLTKPIKPKELIATIVRLVAVKSDSVT